MHSDTVMCFSSYDNRGLFLRRVTPPGRDYISSTTNLSLGLFMKAGKRFQVQIETKINRHGRVDAVKIFCVVPFPVVAPKVTHHMMNGSAHHFVSKCRGWLSAIALAPNCPSTATGCAMTGRVGTTDV